MKKLMAVAMLAPLAAGCATWETARVGSRYKDKPASDFELTALDGARVRLSSLKGKPVVVAFWAFG